MRKLKWILGGLFAFLVALLVAAYVVIANYPVEDLKALIQQQAEAATGRKLEIRGDAAVEVSFTPSIVLEDVHFQNAPWAEGDDLVSMRRFEIQVEVWPLLSGELRVTRFVMVDPVILLERNAQGEGNWELAGSPTAAGAEGGLGNLPSFQSVLFTNARVVLKDAQAGIHRTLELASLEASGRDLVSPIAVRAVGSLDAVPFDLAIDLASVEQMASGGAFPVTVKGALAGGEIALTGSATPPGGATGNDFTLTLSAPRLAPLGLLAGVPLPDTGPFTLSAHLIQNGEVASLNGLAATLGGSDLAGNITVESGGERPLLRGDLAAKRLVVADLGGGGVISAAPASSGLFSEDPLPVEFLRLVDADLKLTADELVLRHGALTALTAQVALRAGRLEVTPLSLGYGKGALSGSITVDAAQEPPALAVDLRGSGLDLAEASGGAMTGSLALDLDLTARGATPKALAATLGGRSEVSSGDGRIDSALLAVASAPLHGLLGPLFGGGSDVRLNCLVSRMAWKEGIGTNQGTAIDASTFSVIGNGTVNLRNETIDFYVDTWTKDTALVGLAVPVMVRGPLLDPAIAPDPAGTALGLAKTAGLIVFPPAGLAAIISDREQAQEGNACVAVTQEVEAKGGPDSFFESIGGAAGDLIEGAGDAAKDAGDAIEKGAEDAIEGLKSIFN